MPYSPLQTLLFSRFYELARETWQQAIPRTGGLGYLLQTQYCPLKVYISPLEVGFGFCQIIRNLWMSSFACKNINLLMVLRTRPMYRPGEERKPSLPVTAAVTGAAFLQLLPSLLHALYLHKEVHDVTFATSRLA
jgi:hypothetical protein